MRGMKAVGYVRVSTEEQARLGVSLEAQEERIRLYCQLQGLELVELIREEGVSAALPLADRPGGARALRILQQKTARNIVALKLDRLFRDAEDALRTTREWDRAAVALHLVDMGGQSLNSASAMGRLFVTMIAAFAELERNLISERTTTALGHKKAHGQAYARTPFGFDRVGDELKRNAREWKLAQKIRARRAAGETLQSIADWLNESGAKSKRGGKWFPSTVRYILENDLYRTEEKGADS